MSTLIRGLGRLFLFLAFGATCARLWAQPPLTTIRDTVYRADGKPFNGLAIIEWKTFQSSNNANIGTQGTTVSIVNGALYVRLVPTPSANNAYYLVRYNSDGQFQFSEIWSVPPSSAALRLRDVRARLLPGGALVGGGAGGVIGGEVTGAILPNFGDAEVPSGVIDGTNRRFTLTSPPSPAASLALFRNGLLQLSGNDYILAGSTITFNSWGVPQPEDILGAFYRTAGTNVSMSHSLLSVTHSDTTPSTPTRGGLIVGQGQPATWSQLLVGPTGRCLTSNGVEVQWGNCLPTGLTPGAVPFVDSNGTLTQSPTTLAYDNAARRLSVGNPDNRVTLNVYDASANGVTELVVRAGVNQLAIPPASPTPLQTWANAAGVPLAFMNADGGFNVSRIITNSSSIRPGIRDPGTDIDPGISATVDGDTWFNRLSKGRKTFEAGQTHSSIQVICSNAGGSTSGTAFVDLGTCTLPANLLFTGDRLEIEATYLHTGAAASPQIDVLAGGLTFAGRGLAMGDDVVALRISIGISTTTAAWVAQSFGVGPTTTNNVGQGNFASGSALGQLRLRGRMQSASTDTIRLLNFTVRRTPQQANP